MSHNDRASHLRGKGKHGVAQLTTSAASHYVGRVKTICGTAFRQLA